MKKAIVFLFVFVNLLAAQEIGKIFKNEEVPEIFGEKISEVKVEAQIIKDAIPQCNNYILFKIHNDGIIITDIYQNIIYSTNKIEFVEPEWVFKLFSMNKVEELFDTVSEVEEKFVYFETREKDFVIRYENKSLDFGLECPPHCIDPRYANTTLYINDIMVSATY